MLDNFILSIIGGILVALSLPGLYISVYVLGVMFLQPETVADGGGGLMLVILYGPISFLLLLCGVHLLLKKKAKKD